MIGRIVGQYKIVEKLGEGGMGAVYRGVDQMVERQVAIKVLRPEISNNPDVLERFRTEAVALARLNHPSIATLYSFFTDGNEFFMVMEFVPGETLEKKIQREGAQHWQTAVNILLWVLEAMQHAHNAGILHRDLKPANIMITPDGRVKVTDFGIARIVNTERLTREAKLVGTLEYLAPERALGHPADARSDLYSLGVVFFEMLTGRLPFQADTDFALIRAQLETKPPNLSDFGVSIPPQIEQALMKSLAKDPAARYPDAASFAAQFREAVRSTGMPMAQFAPGARKATPAGGAPRPSAPSKLPVGIIASVAAGLVLLLAAVFGIQNYVHERDRQEQRAKLLKQQAEAAGAQPAQPVVQPIAPAVALNPSGPGIDLSTTPTPAPGSSEPAAPKVDRGPAARSAAPSGSTAVTAADVLSALEDVDGPVPSGSGPNRPLHYAGVLRAVRAGGPPYLVYVREAVQQRGVNFQLNPQRSAELRQAGCSESLLQLLGSSYRGEAVASAAAPPPAATGLSSPPASRETRQVRSLADVQSLYIKNLPGDFDKHLRNEIASELSGRIRLVSTPSAADALLQFEFEEGKSVMGTAKRVLGMKDKARANVQIVDHANRVLWSAEAGDRKMLTGGFGDSERRVAARIAKKLRQDLSR